MSSAAIQVSGDHAGRGHVRSDTTCVILTLLLHLGPAWKYLKSTPCCLSPRSEFFVTILGQTLLLYTFSALTDTDLPLSPASPQENSLILAGGDCQLHTMDLETGTFTVSEGLQPGQVGAKRCMLPGSPSEPSLFPAAGPSGPHRLHPLPGTEGPQP